MSSLGVYISRNNQNITYIMKNQALTNIYALYIVSTAGIKRPYIYASITSTTGGFNSPLAIVVGPQDPNTGATPYMKIRWLGLGTTGVVIPIDPAPNAIAVSVLCPGCSSSSYPNLDVILMGDMSG